MTHDAAVIGDVHLNVARLRELLDVELAAATRIVLLGDLLDRGSGDPAEAIDAVLADRRVTWLCGNHELAYLGGPVYRGMREPAGRALAPRLRELVIDGRLQAAVAVDGVLCVHGGIGDAYFEHQLRAGIGPDPTAIAADLNRRLLHAVVHRDFSHPAFGSLVDPVRGPFWASLGDDLLAGKLPPLAQAVGHTKVPRVGWHACPAGGSGRVLATCLAERDPQAPGWAWLAASPAISR